MEPASSKPLTADNLAGFRPDALVPELSRWLEVESVSLGVWAAGANVSPLSSEIILTDSTSKYLVRSSDGRPRGVVTCSAFAAPEMVSRSMLKAQAARAALGDKLGSRVLQPILEGRVLGLS